MYSTKKIYFKENMRCLCEYWGYGQSIAGGYAFRSLGSGVYFYEPPDIREASDEDIIIELSYALRREMVRLGKEDWVE